MTKTTSFSWADSPEARAAAMAEAHQARHRAGREASEQRSAQRTTRSQDKADERRNHATWKRRRRAEDRELAALAYRRFRVEVPIEQRPKRSGAPPRRALNRKVSNTGSSGPSRPEGELREVYLQWCGRGFGSGREWNTGRKRSGQPRPARWRAGEARTKVIYITRADALVDVPGAILSNIGTNVEELGACFLALEELEQLGRANANVYYHAIVSIDASLSPKAQAGVLGDIVMPLQEAGLGYVATLHRPDPDGDQRNVHIHVILTLRPVERVAPYEWNFGVSKLASIDTPEGLRSIRHHVAQVMNAELATEGRGPRWTARSRAERGLKSPGNTKRGPIATARERSALAWHREQAKIEAKEAAEKLRRRLKEAVARLDIIATALAEHHRDLARHRLAAVTRIRATLARAKVVTLRLNTLKERVTTLRAQQRAPVEAAQQRDRAAAIAKRNLMIPSQVETVREKAEHMGDEAPAAELGTIVMAVLKLAEPEPPQIQAEPASVVVATRTAAELGLDDISQRVILPVGQREGMVAAIEDATVAVRHVSTIDEVAQPAPNAAQGRASVQVAREAAEAIRAKYVQNARLAAEDAAVALAARIRAPVDAAVPASFILVDIDGQRGPKTTSDAEIARKHHDFKTIDPIDTWQTSRGYHKSPVASSTVAVEDVAVLPAGTTVAPPAARKFAGGVAEPAQLLTLLVAGRSRPPPGTTIDNVAAIGTVQPMRTGAVVTDKPRPVAPTVDGPALPVPVHERGLGR